LIAINICDTGIGIEDAKKEIIFSAFGQAETSDTRGHEGSGLGLTIARHLTELLGGELNLQTSTKSGTTISILLPLNYGSKLDHLKTDVAPDKAPKLLIVEDHPESRQFLSAVLSKLNYTLIMALDGEDALKKIQANQDIDLVIMDIKLPKMDGLEATKKIKAIRAELPVIAVTANALSDDREKALRAGCNAYLSKPVDKVQLINNIKQLL
jgi:CheY-like chemotaxis protein